MQPKSGQDGAVLEGGEDNQKYLLFAIGDELYGTQLTEVREVIRLSAIKPVPYMVRHFKGVINLRGQIIGVVDLRAKFDMTPARPENGLILVIESPTGLLGAIVDDVTMVTDFAPNQIEPKPIVETKIPMTFFNGIARLDDRLVNLINIAGTLSNDDYAQVQRIKEAV